MKGYFDKLESLKNSPKEIRRTITEEYVMQVGYIKFSHDLVRGFPLVITPIAQQFQALVGDSLWSLSGDNNIHSLLRISSSVGYRRAYDLYLMAYKKYLTHPDIVNILPFEDQTLPYTYEGFLEMVWHISPEKRPRVRVMDYTLGDIGILGQNRNELLRKHYYPNLILSQLYNNIHTLCNSVSEGPLQLEFFIPYGLPQDSVSDITTHKHLNFSLKPLSVLEKEEWWATTFPESPFNKIEDLDQKAIPKYFLNLDIIETRVDLVKEVPFNFATLAFILNLLAKTLNLIPGTLSYSISESYIRGETKEYIGNMIDGILAFRDDPLPELEFSRDFDNFLSDVKFKEKYFKAPINFMGFAKELNQLRGKPVPGLFDLKHITFD